jgi:hypothetical protein
MGSVFLVMLYPVRHEFGGATRTMLGQACSPVRLRLSYGKRVTPDVFALETKAATTRKAGKSADKQFGSKIESCQPLKFPGIDNAAIIHFQDIAGDVCPAQSQVAFCGQSILVGCLNDVDVFVQKNSGTLVLVIGVHFTSLKRVLHFTM